MSTLRLCVAMRAIVVDGMFDARVTKKRINHARSSNTCHDRLPPSWAKTGTPTTNHTAGPSSTRTARSAKPWWRSTLPGRVNSSTWATKNSTQARSSSKTVEQWTKALCASAFQYFQLLDIKVTMCSLYCKNDLEMSDAKEKQRFCLGGPNCFCCDLRNKAFSTMPSMGCDVFGLTSV